MKYLSIDLGIKNLGVCILTLPDEDPSLDLLRQRKSNKHPFPRNSVFYDFMSRSTIDLWSLDQIGQSWESADFLVKAICQHVEAIVMENSIEMILIERQPAFNRKTTILLFSLYAYFLKSIPVRIVNAGLKVKMCKLIGLEKEKKKKKTKKESKKDNYDQNKDIAVKGCSLLIEQKLIPFSFVGRDGKLVDFNRSKKKDDVADALLQGIAFHIYQPKIRVREQQNEPKGKTKKTKKRKAPSSVPSKRAKRRKLKH